MIFKKLTINEKLYRTEHDDNGTCLRIKIMKNLEWVEPTTEESMEYTKAVTRIHLMQEEMKTMQNQFKANMDDMFKTMDNMFKDWKL